MSREIFRIRPLTLEGVTKMMPSRQRIHNDHASSFLKRWEPILKILSKLSPLHAKGNRPLKMDFEHQLKAFIFFHLEEHTSASHLLQVLQADDFAAEYIAPPEGIATSRFSEANNTRSIESLSRCFRNCPRTPSSPCPRNTRSLVNVSRLMGH